MLVTSGQHLRSHHRDERRIANHRGGAEGFLLSRVRVIVSRIEEFMSEKPTEALPEKTVSGATRRDLFQIGNMLALPVLMSAWTLTRAVPRAAQDRTGNLPVESAWSRLSIVAVRSPSSAHPSSCRRCAPRWRPPVSTTSNWTSWRTRSGGVWPS